MKKSILTTVLAAPLFIASCGAQNNTSSSSLSEDTSHRRLGTTIDSSSYSFNGDKVTLFAGDYKGDFSYDDCNNASRTIRKKFRDAKQTTKWKSPKTVTLDPNKRFLVFGFRNETSESRRHWLCVNIGNTGHTIYFYQAGEHKRKFSSGWVKKIYNVNGTKVQLQVADMDRFGEVRYTIRNPD